MVEFIVGFAIGIIMGGTAVIAWALCAAQKDTEERDA